MVSCCLTSGHLCWLVWIVTSPCVAPSALVRCVLWATRGDNSLVLYAVRLYIWSPSFWNTNKLVTTDDGVNYEKRLAKSKWFIYIYTVGCEGIFRFFIPCSLLIIIFVCLIRVLCTRRRPLDFPEGRPMDNRLTALVTVVMGVILGCTVPHGILIVTEVYRFRGDSERIKVVTEDVVDYAFPVLSCLIILNSSVNFLFYIVCMKEFRRISCKRCVAEEQSVEWDEISYSSQNPNGAAETAFLT